MSRAATLLAVLAPLAGCELVFPLDGGDDGDDGDDGVPVDAASDGSTPPPDDAGVTRQCGPWPQPTSLGFGGVDPSLSEDELEIIYARFDGASYDLFRRTRQFPTDGFGPEEPILPVNTPASENDPALSRDGTVMLYASNVTGSPLIYEVRRASIGMPFSDPQVAAGLSGIALGQGLDLSPDGLTVYYDTGTELRRARRLTQFDNFGGSEPFAPRSRYPGVSRDELELFHNAGSTLEMRSRGNPSDGWSTQVTLDPDGGDGDLSYDFQTVVADSGPEVVIYRRTCD